MDLRALSDPDLMLRVASGDREAIGVLYDRFAPRLLAVGMRILRDRVEAEDALHDVFMEAWSRAHQWVSTRGSVAAWLVVRMRSRCFDRLRVRDKSRRCVKLLADQDVELRVPLEARPDALASALDGLPEQQRTIVHMRFVLGLSFAECAQELEIPVGTAKSGCAAALEKLRLGLARRS